MKSSIKMINLKLKFFLRILARFSLIKQYLYPKKVPIIINSFNQLSYLKKLILYLETNGYNNIIILDNQSTYKPLLNYYGETQHRVIFLDKNYGHMALWESGHIKEFYGSFFAYTDPDILPCEECPSNFMKYFITILSKNPCYKKVGFSLKINDIPDHYKNKEKVIKWEQQFWLKQLDNSNYVAGIDTTFALYAPNYYQEKHFYTAIRTGGNYIARHLAWYENSSVKNSERLYYESSANSSASWTINIEQKNNVSKK